MKRIKLVAQRTKPELKAKKRQFDPQLAFKQNTIDPQRTQV